MKVSALHQGLIRKGLITNEDELTIHGKELLAFLETKGDKKFIKKKPASEDFLKWYNAYPGTDTFVHKGKKFTGSRKLRAPEHDCRLKFDVIMAEGKYTPDQLLRALALEVIQKKDISVKEGTNKLSFMQNSLTYLNQRSFAPFVELLMGDQDTEVAGSTDI